MVAFRVVRLACRLALKEMHASPIDLCSPDSPSRESDSSEYVPSPQTQTPSPTASALGSSRRAIRSAIVRRQSLRLRKNAAAAAATASAKNRQKTPCKDKKSSGGSHAKAQTKNRTKTSGSKRKGSSANSKKRSKKCTKSTARAKKVTTTTTTPMATLTATLKTSPVASATATITTTVPVPVPVTPVANAYYVPGNVETGFTRFHRVLSTLRERIALDPENNSLDLSACICPHCPYSTGLLSSQRFILMKRAFQINQVLLNNPGLRDEYC